MKYIQQLDESDCAAACLSMIASHFGKALSISEIRKYAGTNFKGTTLKGILVAAKKYGMIGKAVKGGSDSISKSIPTPFVAHCHFEHENDSPIEHFVVVKRIFTKYIEIWDPDPNVKKKIVSYKKFNEF